MKTWRCCLNLLQRNNSTTKDDIMKALNETCDVSLFKILI